MKSIRIGNDFIFLWKLYRGSKPEKLSLANNFTLTLYKRIFGRDGIKVPYSIVDNNTIKVEITPQIADINGNYYFKVSYNLNDSSLSDNEREVKRDVAAFQIVPRTFQSDDVYEVTVVTNILSDDTGVEVVKPPITKPKAETLRRIRKGNDFVFDWKISKSDKPEEFSKASNIKLFQYCKRFGENKTEITDYRISDGLVSIDITSEIAKITGVYYYELHYDIQDYSISTNKRKCTVDISAFQIVERTSHADDVYKIETSSSIDPTANYDSIVELLEYLISQLNFDSKYLSKINDDVAAGLIRFLQGAEFGDFIPGMFAGRGAKIDEHGNIEATSLTARGKISAPEYQFNRITIIGDELIMTENGTINDASLIEGRTYFVEMDVEEGEPIAFQKGDLVKGIFHEGFSFNTSYLIVDEVFKTSMNVKMALDVDTPTQSNLAPQQFMKIARVGHQTLPERQRYMVFSSKLGGYQFYDGCSTFLNGVLAASLDTSQGFKNYYGELPLKEGLPYLYAKGIVVEHIVRVDYKGVPVREIYDRGQWQEGETYYNNINGTDDVWHLGCRWRCFSESTQEEPSWTSPAWIMIEGRSDVRMEFDSSNGLSFFAGQVETTITPIVFVGNTNVSKDIVEDKWKWVRESGDAASDAIWNAKNDKKRLLDLRNEDMGVNWSRENPVRFICSATYPASDINTITNYLEV